MSKRWFACKLILLLAAAAAFAQRSPDAAFENQLQKASVLFRTGKYDDAISQYKRASKMKPDDPQPHWGLAQAYQKVGAYRDSVESARRLAALSSDKIMQVNAHNLAGVSLTAWAEDKHDSKKFQEAEQEFQTALALLPDSAIVHLNLGTVLLKEGRDVDGSKELKRCLECDPSETVAKSAHRFLDNPRRARENFAPDFSVTTLDGQYLSLDQLRGKVVLLDFWATWCSPCRAAVGDLQHLYKKYADQAVVMISVSADTDEQAWRKFVTAKKMEWPQYFDGDRKVRNSFGVHAFPTYVVLDAEGIIHKVAVGGGASQVEDEIRKALKTLAAQPKPPSTGL